MNKHKELNNEKLLIPPDDSEIQYCGRVVHTSDKSGAAVCRFDWPGTEIRFTVKGSKKVYLKMDGANNFFNLIVDNSPTRVLACEEGSKEYLVTDNLDPDVETRIRVYKRTEAVARFPDKITGCVTIEGLLLVPGGSLVKHNVPPPRVIEFVGDSDTAAYGNLGIRTGFEVADLRIFADPSKQDAAKSWAAFVAGVFRAECHNISWSGMGAVWNAPGTSADGAMNRHYCRLLATEGDQEETLASSYNPVLPRVDLVVLYIGGNDWWTLEQKGDDAFVEGYIEFLILLRYLRPGQPIIVLTPNETSGSCLVTLERQRLFSEDMKRVLERAVDGAGGESKRIHLRKVVPQPSIDVTLDEDWGLMEHWSAAAHQKWAQGVIPLIEEVAGWNAEVKNNNRS